jgi:hypothetical protein
MTLNESLKVAQPDKSKKQAADKARALARIKKILMA